MYKYLALIIAVVVLVSTTYFYFNVEEYEYTTIRGEIIEPVPTFNKWIIENQFLLFGVMVGISVLIIVFRWDKFIKNSKNIQKYLNDLEQR